MTCIVGVREENTIWIGGDSAGVNVHSLEIVQRIDQKVFEAGGFLFGFTSSFRMGQILEAHFEAPREEVDDVTGRLFVVKKVIPHIRKLFTDHGWMGKYEERQSGGCFLLASKHGLFTIFSDFQVAEQAEQFDAVGCGEQFALGALRSMAKDPHAPKGRARAVRALEVAALSSAGVRAPFIVKRLDVAKAKTRTRVGTVTTLDAADGEDQST